MTRTMEYTSVPHWALEATAQNHELPMDPRARACTILSYDAHETAARWSAGLRALGVSHEIITLPAGEWRWSRSPIEDPEVPEALSRRLGRATVGWRLLIAGPLPDVLRARALGLEAGLLDAEILVATTRVEELPVMCVHCEAITVARASIDDVVECGECREPLLVHHHVSRRKASFLGFKVDAEEWAVEGVAA